MSSAPRLRIGELSRRVGVSPELLRAWETRYGLLQPERTAGGLRLFSAQDERRVRLMRAHIAAGLSASEAARLAKLVDEPVGGEGSAGLVEIASQLDTAFERVDESAIQATLDRLFGDYELEAALSVVILPFLSRLGERWASGERSLADEHFASHLIGGRLRGLTRGWGVGVGPRAILACPPGERHDLGLLCFGLALREHGWRITYLGAETPVEDIASALDELAPEIVVLSAVATQALLASSDEIRALGRHVRVAIGGSGATPEVAGDLAAELLGGDLFSEASRLAR